MSLNRLMGKKCFGLAGLKDPPGETEFNKYFGEAVKKLQGQ